MNLEPWQEEETSGPAPTATYAAVMVWIVGVLQVLMFGAVSCILAAIYFLDVTIPPEQAAGMSPEQMKQYVRIAAIVLFVLGFMPGVAYLFLGFGVRSGKTSAINLTLLLLITQGIVLGALLVVGAGQAMIERQPAALTVIVLFYGTPLAVLVATIYRLLAHQRAELRGSSD